MYIRLSIGTYCPIYTTPQIRGDIPQELYTLVDTVLIVIIMTRNVTRSLVYIHWPRKSVIFQYWLHCIGEKTFQTFLTGATPWHIATWGVYVNFGCTWLRKPRTTRIWTNHCVLIIKLLLYNCLVELGRLELVISLYEDDNNSLHIYVYSMCYFFPLVPLDLDWYRPGCIEISFRVNFIWDLPNIVDE